MQTDTGIGAAIHWSSGGAGGGVIPEVFYPIVFVYYSHNMASKYITKQKFQKWFSLRV